MNQDRVIETRMNGPVLVRLCGAKKRDGGSCCAPAMANGRCRVHGGKAASGVANGAYKHGRYSQSLPKGLYEDVERILADGDLLNLRDDLALNAARIAQLLAGLTDAETPTGFWQAMEGLVEQMRVSVEEQDRSALMEILLAIQSRTGERQIWRDIRETQQVQVKLADTERKRMRDASAFITKAEMMVALSFVLQAVLETCGREAAKIVGQRLAAMFATKPGGAAVVDQARTALSHAVGRPLTTTEDEEDDE